MRIFRLGTMGIKAVAHTGDRFYMFLFSRVPGKSGLDSPIISKAS
ncbi:hypothetical protein GXM_01741 [Nostoc sphaeroides CCNUC1]|uniref:Uncharacterized protein n=1 Tax=Nostoc sphaeroides CCNUC1 TaxID=2653204 RepID=A0A5P8VV22_9NOSO|nr:hypothetical protein GXM_01741 [Nostoc sphaeroides CCNUC1]